MPLRRRRTQRDSHHLSVPEKTNRVLHVILIALLLIAIRMWHLTVVESDSKIEEARKPRHRAIIEPACRATIRDRFNIPLATNQVQYHAAIVYAQLHPPPPSSDLEQGKTLSKRARRKEYISQFAQLLSGELHLDRERLEDLIYSKASLYNSIPFVIKDDITEQEYYRLKMLEKDWPGIHVQRHPKRTYPQGRVASDLIGYMGAINRLQYDQVIQEMKMLEQYIQERDAGEEPPLPEGLASPREARNRLKDLQERAYTITDSVGKAGIERMFEEQLRGFHGRRGYYSDARGNFLRELPGTRDPLSGQRFVLTISAELQEFAEQLLAQNEKIRDTYLSGSNNSKKLALKAPWIKGGAIIAMDPHNGEVLAMATYPRFDPNDFIPSGNVEMNQEKRAHILKWLESEDYVAEMWDQKRPLEREVYDQALERFVDEGEVVSWERYLDFILAVDSPVKHTLEEIGTIENAVKLQRSVQQLQAVSEYTQVKHLLNMLYTGEEHVLFRSQLSNVEKEPIAKRWNQQAAALAAVKRQMDRYLSDVPYHYDKLLIVDLCRIAAFEEHFTPEVLHAVGSKTLSTHRNESSAFVAIAQVTRQMGKELFHDLCFKEWRLANEKSFLKQKRAEERLRKAYPKPYIDYLDQQEALMFQQFWDQHRWRLTLSFITGQKVDAGEDQAVVEPFFKHFLTWFEELNQGAYQSMPWREAYDAIHNAFKELHPDISIAYMKTMRGYRDLNRPLLGYYTHIRKEGGIQLEKHLAGAFYPLNGYGYGRSQAFRQATTQGSIFKLVTAHEALAQNYQRLTREGRSVADLNPLEMTDQISSQGKITFVGYTKDGVPIPQLYKGGRLPRSFNRNIGKLDILKALEHSSNPYFSLLAGDVLQDPEDLVKAAKQFSYGNRTGIDLPGEIPGQVPTDLATNKTGVYSFAIGQHTLVATPLQAAVMLSTIANGGEVLKPNIVNITAGRTPTRDEDLLGYYNYFKYQDSLALVGLDFPLFTALSHQEQKSLIQRFGKEVKRNVFMPQQIRHLLLESMRIVAEKMYGESLGALARIYHQHPEAMEAHISVKDALIGKTSTSQAMEHLDLDLQQGTNMYTHVWFGGIAFDKKHSHVFKDEFGNPELVVVVYLRYGGFGKEAGPVASQIVAKWREIKKRHMATD
jgi:cell division protein FtsI/penicillin-binding protein 2